MVPERAAALISCAPPIPPEPDLSFFVLADRIFLARDQRRGGPLWPFGPGRKGLEAVGLTLGSANVRTLLTAERSAASRAGLCLGGVSVSLTSSSKRRVPSWVSKRRDAESR